MFIFQEYPYQVLTNKKKKTSYLWVFTVPVDDAVLIKESETIYKYLDIARELKKMWRMKVTVILVVVGALGRISKGLEEKLVE